MSAHAHWIIRLPGLPEVDTDQLTLDDAETAEKASGTAWSQLNPGARARDAAALALVVALRAGKTEDEAGDYVKALTLADLRGDGEGAFTFVLETNGGRKTAQAGGDPLPPSQAPSSPTG